MYQANHQAWDEVTREYQESLLQSEYEVYLII
jgi:hypothetical protein